MRSHLINLGGWAAVVLGDSGVGGLSWGVPSRMHSPLRCNCTPILLAVLSHILDDGRMQPQPGLTSFPDIVRPYPARHLASC